MKRKILLHVGGDLGTLQSRAVTAGEFLGEGLNISVQFVFRDDLGNKANAFSFCPGKIPSRERDVKCFLDRNTTVKQARRRRGAVAAANDFRHAELGGVGADHEIVAVDHG